jgi:hypothetical protein
VCTINPCEKNQVLRTSRRPQCRDNRDVVVMFCLSLTGRARVNRSVTVPLRRSISVATHSGSRP